MSKKLLKLFCKYAVKQLTKLVLYGKIVYNIKKGEKVEANPTYIVVTQTDYDLYEVSRWVSGICWIILGCTVYKCFEKRIINFIEGG